MATGRGHQIKHTEAETQPDQSLDTTPPTPALRLSFSICKMGFILPRLIAARKKENNVAKCMGCGQDLVVIKGGVKQCYLEENKTNSEFLHSRSKVDKHFL